MSNQIIKKHIHANYIDEEIIYNSATLDYIITSKGEIVIAHTLLDYEDLEKIEDFYNFIITMFKEQGSTLVNDGFITEDELIDRYEFESELFY